MSAENTHAGDPELVALAAELLAGIEDFSQKITVRIRTDVEYYRTEDHVTFDSLRESTRANVEFVLRSFLQSGPLDVTAAAATGRERGKQGVPLPFVMAAFRVGFSQIWSNLVDRARIQGLVSSEALVDAASAIWSAHDTFAEAMAAAHRDAVLADMLRGEQERSALVAALLEGRILNEATLWDAADILRLPSKGPFVVVAAEAEQLAQEALPGVEGLLRTHHIGSAWRLLPDLQVGILRLGDNGHVSSLADPLRAIARGRVGISPPYTLLNRTGEALRFARMALARGPVGQPHVALFDDAPLAIAAVVAPDAMQRVADTVLGPVLELGEDEQGLLLATLAAWRDSGGSTDATAKQMFCHPNTVRLRLRRLERVASRTLSDPLDAAEVLLALQALQLHPPTPRRQPQ